MKQLDTKAVKVPNCLHELCVTDTVPGTATTVGERAN